MPNYTFSIENPNQQYIRIKAVFPVVENVTTIHLPSWRPGRYELGDFAKNVKGFKILDEKGGKLPFSKLTKDSWQVETKGQTQITVDYFYYAADLNAGSTFLSKDQLYVNPVNCCVFTKETANSAVQLELVVPDHYEIATSMERKGKVLSAANFDELADSPFIASSTLQHDTYEVGGVLFHLWFQGECKPDWERLKKDFSAFSRKQIEKFTEFPEKEYHFFFQIVPYKAYHGVEHCKSTVILLGPTYEVFGAFYKELLGVSSHELYHTWNVKNIRPIEMQPYDFTKENYSELGFICEGITTYMGDLFLLKSGVFELKQYLLEFNTQLQKHFDNPGRFNYSVAESSFDTWLDGYTAGAPGRKVSIYTEGCLLAFVTDVMILKATANKYGLDEVMKRLYFNYALEGKGVSENDYRTELEVICGHSLEAFFKDFIHGTQPYEAIITEALDYLGLELKHFPSKSYAAARLGFKYIPSGQNFLVAAMYSGGPAELGGLMLNDEILAVNDYSCAGELEKWLQYFDEDNKLLTIQRTGKILEIYLPEVQRNFYMEYSVVPVENPNNLQKKAFDAWKN
jgi:predicted metalloprotease with PDZ domain